MNGKRFIAAILMVGVLASIGWQRGRVGDLRSTNGELRVAQEEAARLEMENAELPKLRAAAASESSSAAASAALLRLRNEARQLRAQRSELDRLRAENARLAAEIGSMAVSSQKFSEMEGFVAKESWSNAGFDTPEAALQTFLWAAREGNLARVAECLPAKDGEYLAMLTQPGHEQERDKMVGEFQQMTESSGFRIVEKVIQEEGLLTKGGPPTGGEIRVPTKVLLRIQAVAGGSVVPMSFRLYADGWKVKEF